jgi:hypothetical protein
VPTNGLDKPEKRKTPRSQSGARQYRYGDSNRQKFLSMFDQEQTLLFLDRHQTVPIAATKKEEKEMKKLILEGTCLGT